MGKVGSGHVKATPKKKNQRTKAPRPKQTEKETAESTVVANRPVKTAMVADDFDWKVIFTLGEQLHTGSIDKLKRGPCEGIEWEFSQLRSKIASELMNNPSHDAYIYGSAEAIDFGCNDGNMTPNGVQSTPIVNVILVKSGHHPPEFISIVNNQQGTERIKPFRELKLKWQPAGENLFDQMTSDGPTTALASRVFYLDCMARKCALMLKKEVELFAYEYASLFFMRPSKEFELNKKGKLKVEHAIFRFESKELDEPIDEEFNIADHRLKTFIPDFLDRYDLGEHYHDSVLESIQSAFDDARQEKMKRIALLEGYDREALETIKVVKVYPSNGFLHPGMKSGFVNRYYGSAEKVF